MNCSQQCPKSCCSDTFSRTATCAESVCTNRRRELKRGRFRKGSQKLTPKPSETSPTSLTSSHIEQHNAASGHDLHEDIEKTAENVQSAARSLGFELPVGWRVGGLDDIQKSPMDRWLEGRDIIADGRHHPGEENCL